MLKQNVKIVRKPGRVKFVWDYRQAMLGALAMGSVPLISILFYPIEGYEDFLSTWVRSFLLGFL